MFGVHPERTWMDVLFELELQLHIPADGEAFGIVSSLVGAAGFCDTDFCAQGLCLAPYGSPRVLCALFF
ncbi:Hypothetical protein FKW44_006438 [Caligus rogercresseyi]|uniref:Uncharacterized protein n=1 Tax=Caligus rogercresseyi TaxID=217165 RepID=A0A7T8KDC4_CALRO|nr:Hypothetical protein FKW44_006438 [Caligus rogercresseyi]